MLEPDYDLSPMLSAEPNSVAVARTRRPKIAREYALVLASAGVACEIAEDADDLVVIVERPFAEHAANEIQLYEEENRGWRHPEEMPLALGESWLAAVTWVLLLIATQSLAGSRAFDRDWWERGTGHAGEVQAGELWRTVTALGLHVDPLHLLGNLLFGCLFVALVVEMLGTGLGLFAVIASGALANLANGWINAETFRSVGASTAVFAALGLLGGHRWQQRKLVRRLRRASWIPMLASALLLGYLGAGAGGEAGHSRVDVSGHVLGFLVGAAVGALLVRAAPREITQARFQPWFAVAAFALWFGAWYLALR